MAALDRIPPEPSSDLPRPSSARQLGWLALVALVGFVVAWLLLRDPWGLFFQDPP